MIQSHSLCDVCFSAATPVTPSSVTRRIDAIPSEEPGTVPRTCCNCGAAHTSGIFVTRDGAGLKCQDQHGPL